MKIRSLFLLASGILLLGACAPTTQLTVPPQEESQQMVTLEGPGGETVSVRVEITDDDEERTRGLMGRTSLPQGEGMLFVFAREMPLNFWMKNTLLPLDILYFNGEGVFVSRTTMVPCEADPCPLYPSRNPAAFALEVNAGDPLLVGVGEGWKLTIEQSQSEAF